jgi:hypothetical protein
MENNESLNDLLARAANDPYNKQELALAILTAAKNDMDPAALKAITVALEESKFKEVDSIPITDGRFNEIICTLADNIRGS